MYDAEELKEIEEFNKTVTDICLTQGTFCGRVKILSIGGQWHLVRTSWCETIILAA